MQWACRTRAVQEGRRRHTHTHIHRGFYPHAHDVSLLRISVHMHTPFTRVGAGVPDKGVLRTARHAHPSASSRSRAALLRSPLTTGGSARGGACFFALTRK